MVTLKEVKHYPETNSVEATWVDRIQLPDVQVPAADAVLDDEGTVVTPAVEAHTVPGEIKETVVKCHSYADVQMDMLRADLGADAADYETLIQSVSAKVPANFKSEFFDIVSGNYVRKSDEQIAQLMQSKTNAASLAYLAETDWMVTRFAETGTPIPDDIKQKRQAARDAIVKVEPNAG